MIIEKIETFSSQIISWQKKFGRNSLPWSVYGWGYGVWVSEIMLQQTQVCTILPRFKQFIKIFPTIESLAQAPLEAVLAQWSGLGYYARAKNLHRAAQQILAHHQGIFPTTFKEVLALPGIGPTTAGAILSLAFRQRYPILDGNVKRIFTRYFKNYFSGQIREKDLWLLATKLLPKEEADIHFYNQGLMDLGATVCTFRRAQCQKCPLFQQCDSKDEVHLFEKTKPSLPQRKRKTVKITAFFFVYSGKLYLEMAPAELKIWQELYFFPIKLMPYEQFLDNHPESMDLKKTNVLFFKHLCTHITLEMDLIIKTIQSDKEFFLIKNMLNLSGKWYAFEEIPDIGHPSLLLKVIKVFQNSSKEEPCESISI